MGTNDARSATRGEGTIAVALGRRINVAAKALAALFVLFVAIGLAGPFAFGADGRPPGADCQDYQVPEMPGVGEPYSIYRICLPRNNDRWNGDLFVYAHGYVTPFPDRPPEIPEDQLTLGGINLPNLFTGLGYAFVTTSYPKNGLAIAEGVDDVMNLVGFFEDHYGTAGNVYLAGPSEGGAVTALAIEKYPFVFNGGLAACGPVGSFQKQVNYFGDFRVLFDYFFPALLPGSPGNPDGDASAVNIPQGLLENWETTYVPQIKAAVAANPAAVQQLLNVSGAPIDQNDPETVIDTVLDVLWYNVFSTNDARVELGGQPFDNSRKWYRGSDNDLALNLGVERFKADPAAAQNIADHYETSGDVEVPLVTLHTIGDPVIPYWQEPLYRRKIVANGDGGRHVNLPINSYGHCQFTAAEALGAFALLVRKVTGEDASTLLDAVPQP